MTAPPRFSARRLRFWLLRLATHLTLTVLFVLSLGAMAVVAVAVDARFAERLESWLDARIAAEPEAADTLLRGAVQRHDYQAQARYAERFINSIPLPDLSDTFADRYRQALRRLLESGEHLHDLSLVSRAGQLAWKFDPHDSVTLFAYGRDLAAAKRYKEAIPILEAVHAIRPMSASATALLADSYRAAGESAKIAPLQERHMEAVALSLTLPSWRSAAVVYYRGSKSQATRFELSLDSQVEVPVTFAFPPNGVYVVLPTLPFVRLHFDTVDWIEAEGETSPLAIDAQQQMRQVDERTVEVVADPTRVLDEPGVVGFKLPQDRHGTLLLRVRVEPLPVLQPWLEKFGTWSHPRRPPLSDPSS
jgi:hypothetical protein